ncbi:MAG: hypothetical protein A4S09_08220 [Proteobacteria bacterium SG_bin7]|nr:MAG: hypothetical protein A4S09_08220 [Proteobacteria bacterium SG_bin7]
MLRRDVRFRSLIFLFLITTACQKNVQDANDSLSDPLDSPFKTEKLQLDMPTLMKTNSAFSKANSEQLLKVTQMSLDKINLPKGMPLIFIMDNNCRERSEFSVPSGEVSTLDHQAHIITVSESVVADILAKRIKNDPCVVGAANDVPLEALTTPNDPQFASQRHLTSIQASLGYDIFYGSTGILPSANIIMAVVDSGVDYTHQDLAANMWKDAQGNFGYDFVNRDSDPRDDFSHGTHVAGLMAATTNNAIGVAGVMGIGGKIMAVKVLGNTGSGSSANAINGINYAVQNGAKVINLSIGGYGKSAAWEYALGNAVNSGAVIVVAAGNSNLDITSQWYTPASYSRQFNGMISVGAYDSTTKGRSPFSNYSTTYVEIGAPGSNGIFSTMLGNTYGTKQGTSMATPIVAGAVGLTLGFIKSRNYALPSPQIIENLIFNSAPSHSALTSSFKGGKMTDLSELAKALNQQYPVQSQTPQPAPAPEPAPAPAPAPDPNLISFALVRSDSNQDIGMLTSGATISLSSVGSKINIRANATADAVVFTLDGLAPTIDKLKPFAAMGDNSGDYLDWTPAIGAHTLQVITYVILGGSYREKEAVKLQFNIVP